MKDDFDLVITAEDLAKIAPELVDALREFVSYGLCRQNNTFERKSLAERFAGLASETMKRFPDLKLNHVGAKTIVS